jgi:hypothetical protein
MPLYVLVQIPDSNPNCPVHISMIQINETEIVKYNTCQDMAIKPYTALYSSIWGINFAKLAS